MGCIAPAACGVLIFFNLRWAYKKSPYLNTFLWVHRQKGPPSLFSQSPSLQGHPACSIWYMSSLTHISDKFSRGRSLASVTSIMTLLPGREPVPQRSAKSKHWVKPKRRVVWCVLSLTPLMMEFSTLVTGCHELPGAHAESKEDTKQFFSSDFVASCNFFRVDRIGCWVAYSVSISGYFPIPHSISVSIAGGMDHDSPRSPVWPWKTVGGGVEGSG